MIASRATADLRNCTHAESGEKDRLDNLLLYRRYKFALRLSLSLPFKDNVDYVPRVRYTRPSRSGNRHALGQASFTRLAGWLAATRDKLGSNRSVTNASTLAEGLSPLLRSLQE